MSLYTIIAFILYFFALIAVGLLARRKSQSSADFLVGNRSLNFWVTALSAHASDMSSWLFMAFPMAIYIGGLENSILAFALCGGMWLNWQFVAPKLRQATGEYESFTLSSYLEQRYADCSKAIRLVSAAATLLFVTYYIAAGLTSMGFLFELIFQIDYYVGLCIATAVILSYTLIGGYVAVAWTDFFQGIFLLIAIILVPVVACNYVGGFDVVTDAIHNQQLKLAAQDSLSGDNWWRMIEAASWGLGYFGMPHILNKFMGIKNTQDIIKAKFVGMSWQIASLVASLCVAFVALAYFKEQPENPELIFVYMVKDLFHPLAAGLILCGLLAATISTIDSQILVVSSTISQDLYKNTVAKEASNKSILNISRLAILGTALVALVISLSRDKTIYETVFYAWTGLGCAFGPLMLFSLHHKKATGQGALAGLISGLVIAASWPWLQTLLQTKLPGLLVGFVISSAVIWIVSHFTKTQTGYE